MKKIVIITFLVLVLSTLFAANPKVLTYYVTINGTGITLDQYNSGDLSIEVSNLTNPTTYTFFGDHFPGGGPFPNPGVQVNLSGFAAQWVTGDVIQIVWSWMEGESQTTTYELLDNNTAPVMPNLLPTVALVGGSVGPTPPDAWATVGTPADPATDVALDAQLTWTYEGEVAPTGYELIWNGGDAMDLGNVLTYNPGELAYETAYTWSIKPYVDDAAKKGMKASRVYLYPEGDMPVWSFTTMDAPEVYPTWATNATPVNEATDVALMPTLTWTYDGPEVDGYEIWVDGVDLENDVTELEYTFTEELAYNSEYTWGVRPFINVAPEGKATKGRPVFVKRYPEEGTVPTTTFTTTDEAVIPGDIEITIVVPVGGSANAPTEVPVTIGEVINDVTINEGLLNFRATINQAPGTYTFTFAFGWSDISVWIDGVAFNDFTFVDGNLVFEYTFTAKKEPIEIFAYDPNTLPVELSSFTAQAHANEYVTLKWVTESESNLHGYNVYRAETENQDQAIRINPSVVAANNETQTQTYTYTDNEVEATTYYYWLEVSELANENSFYGPKVVTVEDDPVVPGITETVFRNFGPSPFSESTSTSLRVKEGETATVTIYNLLGQVVSRESFNAGEYNFEFNGRDLNNKKVANGIYFVRMTSPTQSRSFKIVKMK